MRSPTNSSIPARWRGLLVGCALSVLGLVACSGDDEAADEAQGDGDAAIATEPVRSDELEWTECENLDEGFVLPHPLGWEGGAGGSELACGEFHPDGHPDGPVVELDVVDRSLASLVTEADDAGTLLDASTLDRRAAARVAPADPDGVRWWIDLRNARTLELTGATSPTVDATTLALVVERMTEQLRWIDPRSSGEGLEPVGAPVDDVVEGRTDGPGGPTQLLTDLRAAAQDGFDRIVVELDGDRDPDFLVEPLAQVPVLDEAGIPVEGETYLQVTLTPASLLDGDGERSYAGPTRVPAAGGAVVEEAVLVPSFEEDELRVVVGLEREAAFAVAVIPDPVRLVVDVVPDPVVGDAP